MLRKYDASDGAQSIEEIARVSTVIEVVDRVDRSRSRECECSNKMGSRTSFENGG